MASRGVIREPMALTPDPDLLINGDLYMSEPTRLPKVLRALRQVALFLISHVGLISLVIIYCVIGAVTFEKLEQDHEIMVKKSVRGIRAEVSQYLWTIQKNVSMIDEAEWAKEASSRLKEFETELVTLMKKGGWDGREDPEQLQWTYAGALFYSIIVITTIGFGHITPKTDWGKVVTIFYAILGIPLMLMCLSHIGDFMATAFRVMYWKVCCYLCHRRPRHHGMVRGHAAGPMSRARSLRWSGSSRGIGHAMGSHRGPPRRSIRRSARTRISQLSNDSILSESILTTSPNSRRLPNDRSFRRVQSHEDFRRISSKAMIGTTSGGGGGGGRGTRGRRGSKLSPPPPLQQQYFLRPYSVDDTVLETNGNGRLEELSIQKKPLRRSTKSAEPYNLKGQLQRKDSPGGPLYISSTLPILTNKYVNDEDEEDGDDLDLKDEGPQKRKSTLGDEEDEDEVFESPLDPTANCPISKRLPRVIPPIITTQPARVNRFVERPRAPPELFVSADYWDDDEYLRSGHHGLHRHHSPGGVGGDDYLIDYEEEDISKRPVPIWLCVFLIVGYMLVGARLFSSSEDWPFLDSIYFCFVSLTTIGFGDFVPTRKVTKDPEGRIILCSIFLLFGISLLVMSFNLVQEEVLGSLRHVASRLGIGQDDDEDEDDEDEMYYSHN